MGINITQFAPPGTVSKLVWDEDMEPGAGKIFKGDLVGNVTGDVLGYLKRYMVQNNTTGPLEWVPANTSFGAKSVPEFQSLLYTLFTIDTYPYPFINSPASSILMDDLKRPQILTIPKLNVTSDRGGIQVTIKCYDIDDNILNTSDTCQFIGEVTHLFTNISAPDNLYKVCIFAENLTAYDKTLTAVCIDALNMDYSL